MDKNFQKVLIFLGIILLIVFLFNARFISKNQNVKLLNVGKGNLPPLGTTTALITIIEFGDFLCPFCSRAVTDLYPRLKNLINEGKISIYFRDFVVHPEATPIHNAARCANEQGKYWEFNEEIFRKFMNGEVTTKKEIWLNLAKDLKLDLQSFEKCVEENRYFSDIQKDTEEGYNLGVRGTPTFFINGKFIEGINISEIMSTVNQFLNQ